MRQIPEEVAMQGVAVVQEYKDKHIQLNSLEDQINELSKVINMVEHDLKTVLESCTRVRPHYRFRAWKKRIMPNESQKLVYLSKRHEELMLEYVVLDNQYISLVLALYEKGWLPKNWMEMVKEDLDKRAKK